MLLRRHQYQYQIILNEAGPKRPGSQERESRWVGMLSLRAANRNCRLRECLRMFISCYEITTCIFSRVSISNLQRRSRRRKKHRTVILTSSSRYQNPPSSQPNLSQKRWERREYFPFPNPLPRPLLSRIPTNRTNMFNSTCISLRPKPSTGNFFISLTATYGTCLERPSAHLVLHPTMQA